MATIDSTAKENEGSAFVSTTYWRSSAYFDNGAWLQDFTNGNQGLGNKNYVSRVDAVGVFFKKKLFATAKRSKFFKIYISGTLFQIKGF